MMQRIYIAIAFATTLSATAFSQKTLKLERVSENVRIVRDYRLDILLERFNKIDKVRGFRIQIHSGLKKETARKTRSQFLSTFPEITSYETYQQPYFTVTVGDFLTKLEAQRCLNKLREQFPNSFIMPDYIEPLKLGSNRKSNSNVNNE